MFGGIVVQAGLGVGAGEEADLLPSEIERRVHGGVVRQQKALAVKEDGLRKSEIFGGVCHGGAGGGEEVDLAREQGLDGGRFVRVILYHQVRSGAEQGHGDGFAEVDVKGGAVAVILGAGVVLFLLGQPAGERTGRAYAVQHRMRQRRRQGDCRRLRRRRNGAGEPRALRRRRCSRGLGRLGRLGMQRER